MATSAGTAGTTSARHGNSAAQLFTRIVGPVLILVGLLGFLAETAFEFGRPHEADDLLGIFPVNGVHNLVHILTGLLLLAGSKNERTARTVTTIFVAAYALVTLIGFIQGDTVLGIIPTDTADNLLHLALTLAGLAALLASKTDDKRARTT